MLNLRAKTREQVGHENDFVSGDGVVDAELFLREGGSGYGVGSIGSELRRESLNRVWEEIKREKQHTSFCREKVNVGASGRLSSKYPVGFGC
jgi:hypothetical protein